MEIANLHDGIVVRPDRGVSEKVTKIPPRDLLVAQSFLVARNPLGGRRERGPLQLSCAARKALTRPTVVRTWASQQHPAANGSHSPVKETAQVPVVAPNPELARGLADLGLFPGSSTTTTDQRPIKSRWLWHGTRLAPPLTAAAHPQSPRYQGNPVALTRFSKHRELPGFTLETETGWPILIPPFEFLRFG